MDIYLLQGSCKRIGNVTRKQVIITLIFFRYCVLFFFIHINFNTRAKYQTKSIMSQIWFSKQLGLLRDRKASSEFNFFFLYYPSPISFANMIMASVFPVIKPIRGDEKNRCIMLPRFVRKWTQLSPPDFEPMPLTTTLRV